MNTQNDSGQPSEGIEGARAPTGRARRWKASVNAVGPVTLGGIALVGATVAVTFAATQREAQRENLVAYLRGQVDGLKQGGWLDGWTAAEDWYCGETCLE